MAWSNGFFDSAELFLVRLAVFLIFLVGLVKVFSDTMRKILKQKSNPKSVRAEGTS